MLINGVDKPVLMEVVADLGLICLGAVVLFWVLFCRVMVLCDAWCWVLTSGNLVGAVWTTQQGF